MRYFADTPSVKIFNACAEWSPEADVKTTVVVPDKSQKYRTALGRLRRFQFTESIRSVSRSFYESKLEEIRAFEPDLIWCIVCTRRGITVARQVLEVFPKVPCYSSFWDLLFLKQLDTRLAKTNLKYLSDRSTLVDAISDPLAEELTRRTGRSVGVENFFCSVVPGQEHDGSFDPQRSNLVMVGNVWLQDAFKSLQRVLLEARRLRPQTGDVIWYCHRASLERLGLSENRMPSGIVYGGCEWLTSKLRRGDLCLVPIHGTKTYGSAYSRFSLPSRVSELFASEVPVFSIGGPTTAFARYLERIGTGLTVEPEPISSAAEALAELLDDTARRDQMGQRARAFAREHFQIDRFQERLLSRLRSICETR